jgi:FixJ family two-component response regulator
VDVGLAILEGLTNEKVAEKFNFTVKTAEAHRHYVNQAFNAHSVGDLFYAVHALRGPFTPGPN